MRNVNYIFSFVVLYFWRVAQPVSFPRKVWNKNRDKNLNTSYRLTYKNSICDNENNVCECPEHYISFNDECVACSGLNARVNNLGECVCGRDEILNVDGICQCDASLDPDFQLWPLFITIPEGDNRGCVKCYGLGAHLNDDGRCTCEGVVDSQFDAFEFGKCVCKPNIFTVSILSIKNVCLLLKFVIN